MKQPRIRPFTLPPLPRGEFTELNSGEYLELLHFTGFAAPQDAAQLRFEECRFSSFNLQSLLDTRLWQCELERIDSPVLHGAGSSLNAVRVHHSRFGSADFAEADLDSVVFEDCKFGWLNLRGAKVRDVLFRNCQLDEIDLGGNIERVSFEQCRTKQLSLQGASLRQVDIRGLGFAQVHGLESLRGSKMSGQQFNLLAEDLATLLGIQVEF